VASTYNGLAYHNSITAWSSPTYEGAMRNSAAFSSCGYLENKRIDKKEFFNFAKK